MDPSRENIAIFDGVCNLCNGLVRFVIKHDRNKTIRFAPLQSEFGQTVAGSLKTGTVDSDTVIYSRQGKYYFRSEAILYLLEDMGGFWKMFQVFRIVPRILRDSIYDFVARNRYRVFGKRDVCMIPGPGVRDRFVS